MNEQKKVLIVDDEEGMRDSLTFMLESEGITGIRTAKDGEQALEELEKGATELVITDLVMPKMNGYSLMQTIKERWPHTLVIAITGFGSTDSATQCLRRGAFDYITKPFELDVMINTIRRALDRVQLETSARRRAEQIAVMAEITRIINSDLDIHAVFRPFADEVKRILDFDLMNVALFNSSRTQLSILTTTAPRSSALARGESIGINKSCLGMVATSGQPVTKSDLQAGPRLIDEEKMAAEGIRSLVAVPLLVKRRPIGAFCVGSRQPDAYRAADEAIIGQIGGLVATAANNVLLFERIQAQLVTLRQTQSQLIRSARLAAVGELADGVAHEINNPLSVVLGVTQLLLRDEKMPEPFKEDLDRVVHSASRVASIVKTFIEFAKPATGAQEAPVHIDKVIDSALLLVCAQLESAKTVQVEKAFPPDLPLIMGNSGQLEGVFVNIIRNAIEAMSKVAAPSGGHVLRLKAATREARGHVVLDATIEDSGCGIPARDLPRIFEPGFTTKIDRGTIRGLGMGLFSAYATIDAHDGEINVESEPGRGSRVTVTLPIISLGTSPANEP